VMIFRFRQALILARAGWLFAALLNTAVCVADDYKTVGDRAIQLFPQNAERLTATIRQADESGVAADDVSMIIARSAEAGFSAADVSRLLETVVEAGKAQLPVAPFSEKIMEGFAKEVDPKLMIEVLDKKLTTYRAAKKIAVDATQAQRLDSGAVTSVALAMERGVSAQGLRGLFSSAGIDPTAVNHAAQALADLESMGFTEPEGITIAQAGLKAGYLSTRASAITQVAASAQKTGLSNHDIATSMAAGFNRGLPLAEISVQLHGGGPRGTPGGGMRGGRGGPGYGGAQGSGANGHGPGGGRHSN
jgi:hypothetical protein